MDIPCHHVEQLKMAWVVPKTMNPQTTHFNPLTKEKDMGLDQYMLSSSGAK